MPAQTNPSSSYNAIPVTNTEHQTKRRLNRDSDSFIHDDSAIVSNEYVLNVAFLSFFFFTAFQFFFAVIAHSQSMMADCAAMTVDVITYLFNFLAERLKESQYNKAGTASQNKQLRLRRLYLELIPPFISVSTLVAVTIVALQQAFDTLANTDADSDNPDLGIMLVFSALNLLLDFLNVGCFARVDQAVGLPLSSWTTVSSNGLKNDADDDGTHGEQTPLKGQHVPGDDHMDSAGIMNLNMCSAWTHVCADTLRSIAVLIAAGLATIFPSLMTPSEADSYGAIVVSIIILASLGPLFQGLYTIANKIRRLWATDHEDSALPSATLIV